MEGYMERESLNLLNGLNRALEQLGKKLQALTDLLLEYDLALNAALEEAK